MNTFARLFLCSTALASSLSMGADLAGSLAPHMLATLSENTLLTLRLASRKEGAADAARCLDKLPPTIFVPLLDPHLSKTLSQDDLRTIEAFLQTSAGQKFIKVKQLELYTATGEMRPESYPAFTPAEKAELQAFVKTPGGARFAMGDALLTPELKAALQARISELSKQCKAG